MLRRELLVAGVYAAGAFALTMAFLAPGRLSATPPAAPTAVLTKPAMTVDGVELSLTLPGQVTGSADAVALQPDHPLLPVLMARNPTDQSRQLTATVTIYATQPSSPLSRVMPRPTEIWKQQQVVELAPQETLSIELKPDVKLTPASALTFALSAGEQTTQPLRAMVQGLAPQASVSPGR